ncbi:alpha/beta-hydrolase [Cystobasidium minutum MCA 4210]|uniref:alpha/beta-hydrolase n=1 Tax=Cystobasidium minutum MCA 4210 TaxID=1397322 RepID=UPI0034CE71B8|eukprot:jgi/Rhomi1/195090/gm1.3304_g
MPYIRLSSGTEMFYSIPTCTQALEKPYIDPSRATLLFLHGGSADSRSWSEQIEDPVINQNFNIVCVDLPFGGLTRTPKDWTPGAKPLPIPRPQDGKVTIPRPFVTIEEHTADVAELVKKLDLAPLHLIALGVNTAVAYHLLIDQSELLKSCVLLAPVTLSESEDNKLQFVELWRSFFEGDEEDAAEVMHGFYSLYFGPRAGAEPERRAYWNRLWQIYLGTGDCKAYVFGQWATSVCSRETISEEKARSGFRVPICVASGTEHITHPTAHAELEALLKTSPSVPFSESHYVGKAPMNMHVTHPKEVNRIICKLVARCESKPLSVYDPEVAGYNTNWDAPYQVLEVRQQAAEKVGAPAPLPQIPGKCGGMYSLVQSMRRPST